MRSLTRGKFQNALYLEIFSFAAQSVLAFSDTRCGANIFDQHKKVAAVGR